jgi:organic radical activating enzyme
MQCNWLENMMSIETDGWTRPCCLETNDAARISKISEGIIIAFNHPKLLNLRKNLDDGFTEKTRDYCHRCEKLENNNQPSMRTTTSQVTDKRELKVLQFKMSNKCQLTCAHCGPGRSSSWAKLLKITPHVQNAFEVTDQFIEELRQLIPQLTKLKFSGGEPFLDPNHWKILDALKDLDRSHCELEYITNGLVKPRHDLWEGWKKINCSVSVDGFEKSYEWFRRGASWDDLVTSVDSLKKHSRVSINFSMTPYTIQDYHNAKNFWNTEFTTFPVVYPKHTNLLNFPRSIIEKYKNYESIPFYEMTSKDHHDIELYKNWATNWDETWHTPGWAKKLFAWM